MNIKRGQGFEVEDRFGGVAYGLVLWQKGSDIGYVDVRRYVSDGRVLNRPYDSVGAKHPHDKDNVHLKHCPPPFSKMGVCMNFKGDKISNSIAIADLDNVSYMDKDVFQKHVVVLDGGAQIAYEDMYDVLNHVMPNTPQKEKLMKSYDGPHAVTNAAPSNRRFPNAYYDAMSNVARQAGKDDSFGFG